MISPNQQLMSHLKNVHINQSNKKWLIRVSVTAIVLTAGIYWVTNLAKKHKVAAANLAEENSQLQITNTSHQNTIAQKDDQIQQLKTTIENMQQAQAILTKNNSTTISV